MMCVREPVCTVVMVVIIVESDLSTVHVALYAYHLTLASAARSRAAANTPCALSKSIRVAVVARTMNITT